MYFNMTVKPLDEASADWRPQGRFVLHRHHDAEGAHLDLRLEAEGCAVGYRIGGLTLADGAWATEKQAHPLAWLDQDGDAIREDAGTYAVLAQSVDSREIALHGALGVRVLHFAREASLDAASARDVALALRDTRHAAEEAGALLRDGATARQGAVARLCGLGRELDGAAFDAGQWRGLLAVRTLEEIHAQLRSFEARFDAKYPPKPVSQPEPLDEGGEAGRVLELARGL